MAYFAIIGKEPGSQLQWLADGVPNAEEAMVDFRFGIGSPELEADAYHIIEVTDAERAAIEAWVEAGSPAADAPDALYRR